MSPAGGGRGWMSFNWFYGVMQRTLADDKYSSALSVTFVSRGMVLPVMHESQ